jgi:hypothetical protein
MSTDYLPFAVRPEETRNRWRIMQPRAESYIVAEALETKMIRLALPYAS